MRKKIAEGTAALVLAAKGGSVDLLKDAGRARELAETMVAVGSDADLTTAARLTVPQRPPGPTPAGPPRGCCPARSRRWASPPATRSRGDSRPRSSPAAVRTTSSG